MTQPVLPAEPTPARPFSGIVTRGVALSIDGGAMLAMFAAGTVIVTFLFAALDLAAIGSNATLVSSATLWIAFVVCYFIIGWFSSGQTIGLHLMRLRVVGRDGQPPSFCRATVRYFGRLLSILLFFTGYLLVLVHPQRRALHDVLAGTFVVYTDAPDEVITDALADAARSKRGRKRDTGEHASNHPAA